jgi:GAF domain-containing protein
MTEPPSRTSVTTAAPAASEFLQSVVDTARAIFGAAASSVFLFEEEAGELIFQAVSGEGADSLVGTRFPAGRGIVGWVACTGEPMVVDDLSQSMSFARDLAESTAYVPQSLMAAPLMHGATVLGVLEVLDPAPQARSNLSELDLLTLFARQAATALRAVLVSQATQDPRAGGTARALRDLDALDERGRAAGLLVVDALRELLVPAATEFYS